MKIILTGASTGIGRELAKKLVLEGHELGLMARRQVLLESLRDEILKVAPQAKLELQTSDVNHVEQHRADVFKLAARMSGIDCFIANAGIGQSTPGDEENWNTVRQILTTNVLGAIAGIEAAKEIFIKQGHGHLVGVSSVAGFRALPKSSAYCTSKVALTTYLQSLRMDLHRLGIVVTSIHPGYVETPMTAKNKFMPFLISAPRAAEIIANGIRKKKKRVIFPQPLPILMAITRLIPDWLYEGIVGGQYFKGVFRSEKL